MGARRGGSHPSFAIDYFDNIDFRPFQPEGATSVASWSFPVLSVMSSPPSLQLSRCRGGQSTHRPLSVYTQTGISSCPHFSMTIGTSTLLLGSMMHHVLFSPMESSASPNHLLNTIAKPEAMSGPSLRRISDAWSLPVLSYHCTCMLNI